MIERVFPICVWSTCHKYKKEIFYNHIFYFNLFDKKCVSNYLLSKIFYTNLHNWLICITWYIIWKTVQNNVRFKFVIAISNWFLNYIIRFINFAELIENHYNFDLLILEFLMLINFVIHYCRVGYQIFYRVWRKRYLFISFPPVKISLTHIGTCIRIWKDAFTGIIFRDLSRPRFPRERPFRERRFHQMLEEP